MKETLLTILENTRLADGIYRLRLAGDTSAITAPGQFVNLKLSGFFLRRPISVCDWENGEVTLIYKVLGHGTEAMTARVVMHQNRSSTKITVPKDSSCARSAMPGFHQMKAGSLL